MRVFWEPGSNNTKAERPSHHLHPLALLWSNPAGLVRRGIGMGAHLG